MHACMHSNFNRVKGQKEKPNKIPSAGLNPKIPRSQETKEKTLPSH